MTTSPAPLNQVDEDRYRIDVHLRHLLSSKTMPGGGAVREAMHYAVLGCAQRVRPLLSLRVARFAGSRPGLTRQALTLQAAASVELLHCASLIIDDLPCMDDELIRRNKPSVHVAFGEATAVLSAFALVALAARSLVDTEMTAQHRSRMLSFQIRLLGVLDLGGLIAGQELDLQLVKEGRQAINPRTTDLKTVPLFLLAVRAGLVDANVRPVEERRLLEFGRAFGSAFQAVDDLEDGECLDVDSVRRELDGLRCRVEALPGDSRELHDLVDYLDAKSPANSGHR